MTIAPLPVGAELGRTRGYGPARYHVLRLLSQGSFGIAYEAKDAWFKDEIRVIKEFACDAVADRATGQVAIVPRPSGSSGVSHDQLLADFINEARILNTIASPRVVRVVDVWEEHGTGYYAMERIDDASSIADRFGASTAQWPEVERVASALLDGLDDIHRRGVLHFDLKPDNALMAPGGRVVLIDFGAARLMNRLKGTLPMNQPYTLGYAPLELMDVGTLHKAGTWTDLYSWAMIVYGLAVGHGTQDGEPATPLQRLAANALARNVVADPYASAGQKMLDVGIPKCWADVVSACLAIFASDRLKDVAAVRAVLAAPPPVVLQVTEQPVAGAVWHEPITGIGFVWVPPGRFLMGASTTEGERGFDPEANEYDTPAHEVDITQGFWMAEHPVTNASYASFLAATGRKANPKHPCFNATTQPVVEVDFEDALTFAAWLTGQTGLGEGWCFDLPSEAEWEYAARGTDGRKYPWGDALPTASLACFERPPTDFLSFYLAQGDVGRPEPDAGSGAIGGRPEGKSPFGCQDMSGNVWEWCLDTLRASRRNDNKYSKVMTRDVDPCHIDDGRWQLHVARGGSWSSTASDLRCTKRTGFNLKDTIRILDAMTIGFRVVCRGSRRPGWRGGY